MRRVRTAVLISGRGSNLSALLRAASGPEYPADIALVISNRPDAGGLAHARHANIATALVDHTRYTEKQAFEAALQESLDDAKIEVVCLAGFMRLLTPAFVEHWRDRMINIHPSLLPSFKGLATHEQALAAGVRVHGATVHFVRAEMDTGPIIMQGAVPVLPDDTPDSLARRVLQVEHRIYPAALALVAGGKASVLNDRIIYHGRTEETAAGPLISPSL